MTQVFDTSGLRGDPYSEGPAMPGAYGDDFSRSATARIDFGPHEAFGPPPEDVEPEPEPDAEHVFSRIRRIRSHAREKRKRGRGPVGVVVVLLLFAAAAGLKFLPISPWAQKDDGPAADAPIPFHSANFAPGDVGAEGFLSWAYVDWRDPAGSVVGSENLNDTTDTASMITAWFAADLLRRAAEQGIEPSDADRADVESMIRDDDEAAAERILATLGGPQESVERLAAMCRLNQTVPSQGSWRETAMSARDAAKLGGCLADGVAAGAQWTPTLLSLMRQVRGPGDFGIRQAFPSDQRPTIAIKNGLLLDPATGQQTANCLAIGEGWALAVLQRYASTGDPSGDLAHADSVCQKVVLKLTGG